MKTKKAMSVAAALLAGLSCMVATDVAAADAAAAKAPAAMSLAEARGRIDRAVASPAEMKATMRRLSADDQRQYLADVNAAIAKMPGSDEERTATFVAANRAALEGSKKGNVTTLVAEIFATVPLESLPAMNESLASDLMNRSTAKGQTFTDEQYVKLSESVMSKVNARVATVDDGDVRAGFAALMMIRGSNSTGNSAVVDPIVAALPASAQSVAKNEWFPAALGEGQEKTYEPMIGGDGFGDNPNLQPVVLRVAGPQFADSLLVDIVGWNVRPNTVSSKHNPLVDAEMVEHTVLGFSAIDVGPSIGVAIKEARGYPGQTTY